nr:unnamed protein product [Callosobruchus chinensis]
MAKSKFPRKHHQVESKKAGRKSFTCYNCNRIVYSKQDLIIHMKVHDKNFSCKATVYDDSHNNVSEAIGAASSHKILNCALCNATFKTARGRDDHLVKQHPNSIASVDRTIHECTKCAYRTILKHDFDKHNVLIHPEILSPFKLRECIHCNATFKSRASLDDHTLRKHPDFIATITRKIYECTKCGYKTIFKYHFERHMSTHPKIASSYEPKACVHCNATFKRKLWLDDHVVRKHVDFMSSVTSKLHECTKCSYKTVRKKLLDDHIIKKHPEFITSVTRNVYKCTKCTFKTAKKGHFDRHTLMHSGIPSSRKLFTCIHCDVTVKGKMVLTEHVLKKHPDFASSITEKINTCTICNFKTTMKHHFDRHIMKRHPEFTSSLTRKVYECTICPYKTILKFKFDRHMLEHPETASSYKFSSCHHCGAKFKIKADLDEHLVENHPNFIVSLSRKVYECTYCVYKTTSKIALNYHVVKKHPSFITSVTKRTYECAKCLYKTIFKHLFDRHMLMHPEIASSYTPGMCIHCKETFKNKIWLDDHVVKKHPNFITSVTSKLYECSQCIYKTVIERSFDQHMSMHSATASTHKPNPCIHCNATFKNKGSLNDHILKKHPDFVSSITKKINTCTTCNFKTTIKHQFDRHMSVHSGISPISKTFTCIHCDAIVKSRNALTDHVVRKHPNFITSVTNKIYECTQCVYKTVKKYDLDKHLSTHSKTASRSNFSTCIHCNATFNTDK